MPSYTPVSVSSYNASPPDDDGAGANDLITWAGIKTKLADPLKTAIDSIDDNIATAISTITTNLGTATTNLASSVSTYTTTLGILYAPSGTVGLFKQNAAPTGWTKGSTHNNKALRLVSGVPSTGGSTAFTSVMAATTITSSNMPAHTHTWSDSASAGDGITLSISGDNLVTDFSTGSTGGVDGSGGVDSISGLNESEEALSGTVTISSTATGNAGSGTAMDFAVRYCDVIVATKD